MRSSSPSSGLIKTELTVTWINFKRVRVWFVCVLVSVFIVDAASDATFCFHFSLATNW